MTYCERCGCDHQEPMGLKLNPEILDDNTWRKVRTNLEQAGVYHLYFPRPALTPSFSPTFIEHSYVTHPAMMNILIQSTGSGRDS